MINKTCVLVAILLLLNASLIAQNKPVKGHETKLIGDWVNGSCSEGECYTSHFHFHKNGTFEYVVDATNPNPISVINGRYKMGHDSSGTVLLLKITSYEVATGCVIDAGNSNHGYSETLGIFGLDCKSRKTVFQNDSTFYTNKIGTCKTTKEGHGSSLVCPCMTIDGYTYYRVSEDPGRL